MAKREEKSSVSAKSVKVYTNTELDNLWRQIEQFRETKILANGEEVRVINWPRFYQSKGVCKVRVIEQTKEELQSIKDEETGVVTKRLVVVKTGVKFEEMVILKDDFSDEIPYLAVEEMVNQCLSRRGKMAYAESKKLEGLDQLASSMTLP
jgi:hypothetical protein